MLNRYTLPFISALVVSASLASCQRKEVVSVPELPTAGEIGFTVSDSDAETKSTPLETNYFGTNHSPFKVVVYSHAEGATTSDWALYSDTLTCSYNLSYGIWKPRTAIGWPMTQERLTFIACAPTSLSPTNSSGGSLADGQVPYLRNFTVADNVADQVDILLAKKESSASQLVGNLNVRLKFRHALTFVKFSINENITCSSITLSGIPAEGTLDMSTGAWSSVSTTKAFTIDPPTFGDPDANGQCLIDEAYTLMLIPQTLPADATLTAVTSAGTITASLAGQVWEPGKVVTYKLSAPVASFTVSSTGDKVRFSPGNLQAVFADAGSTFTWKFADNQWDYVGNNAANTSINGNGSVSAVGTVDLFGWSTAATKYGIDLVRVNDSGDFVDWGRDPRLVSTLGSGWRTLTKDEWAYLFNTRRATAVNGTPYARFAKACLFGTTHGIIIFPDIYTHPDGVELPAGINKTDGTSWGLNNYDATAWAAMESAGCVFLPAAGVRNNTQLNQVGSRGLYWTSTHYYSYAGFATMMQFYEYGMDTDSYQSRSGGISVRLVQDL